MTEGGEDLSLVGINVTSESCRCHGDHTSDANLGFILVNTSATSVCDLRQAIDLQLETVPASYRFLTKQGWPVRQKQEMLIKASHLIQDDVIRIQSDYGEPRVGVVSESGLSLGFVFISSIQLNLNRLRQAVLAQLNDGATGAPTIPSSQPDSSIRFEDSNKVDPSRPETHICTNDEVFHPVKEHPKGQDTTFDSTGIHSLNSGRPHALSSAACNLGSVQELTSGDWVFLDRNGWPINRHQESTLTILDILVRSSVHVRLQTALLTTPAPTATLPARGQLILDESQSNLAALAEFAAMSAANPPSKMQRMSRTPTMTSLESSFNYSQPHKMQPISPRPDSPFTSKTAHISKQILISYVRAEATQYALDLKTELENLKFSVYLDVHEIFCGTDWQDSLNDAVSNCEIFVPLVTPRYGETQWTNREVKLADVLGKYIVPVSFLDSWPPRCLAIQFATTQFINWKKPKPGQPATPHSPTKDLADSPIHVCFSWDRPDVNSVAKEIGKRCQSAANKRALLCANGTPPITRGKTMSLGDNVLLIEGREGEKPILVISIHPKQQEFGNELKELFEETGYDVWMTTDLLKLSGLDAESDATLILDGDDDPIDGSAPPNPATLFQEKVDEASVVLFVLSKAFAESATCKGQVFYCEQRKRVVPLAYEEFEMPGWMSMLIGTSTFENVSRKDYKDHLVARIAQACDPSTLDNVEDIAKEAQLTVCVEFVCKNLPDIGCVYIAGGTKFYYDKSEAICKAIGEALARLPMVTLVTGGFFGVGEVVSKSFFNERRRSRLESGVWHILPKKDERDCTAQANQKPDKTFQGPAHGKTLYCGDGVRARETIVSRVFDICIIVEGGPGAAHEAEEFVWSDHTVIPVRCTGGAAGGKFKVPHKIFELPPGVSRTDWQLLANKGIPADEIGSAVARIVRALQEGVISQVTCQRSFRQRPALSRGSSSTIMERN